MTCRLSTVHVHADWVPSISTTCRTMSLTLEPGSSMQPAEFAQIKELFAAVCELEEPQRTARLQELCTDPQMLAEVHSLLSATTVDPARLVAPVVTALAQLGGEMLRPGDRLGVWTLREEIGHGGMGTVYSALRSDGHFEQLAAIKLLRGVPAPAALQRLTQERQILARLNHPHIARLLDGGATPAGQPYLVMEYIEGQPIDGYCRDHQLSASAIVRLLLPVCAALEYAHQRLVVHCDLKPSNILVTPEQQPKLLDFGIARLLGEGAHTATAGHLAVGYTPGFASPEQTSGGVISAASDLFGMGRVLEHLLQGARMTRMQGQALTAIVQRACHAQASERYHSVSAFAADLRHVLAHRPVTPLAQHRLYRLRCLLRRNALPLGLAGLTALALLGGLLSTTLSLREARLQFTRAEAAGLRAERTAEFLSGLLGAVDPDRARDLDKTLLRELLDDAARRSDRELAAEPQVLAQIQTVIGSTYHQLGEYRRALAHLERALELQTLEGPRTGPRERLRIRLKIAHAHGALREGPRVLDAYRQIHTEQVAAFGEDDPDALESAAAISYQYGQLGEYPRAAQYSAALDGRLERVLGALHPITLENLQTLAVARSELGEFDAAEQLLDTLATRHVEQFGPYHSRTFSVRNSQVILLLQRQRFEQAQAVLRDLLPHATQHLGERNFKTINFNALMASALRKGGRLEESGPYYALALQQAGDVLGPDNPLVHNYAINYANFEVASGQFAAGLARLDRLLPIFTAISAEHPALAEIQRGRGRALRGLQRIGAARDAWQQALQMDLRRFEHNESHPQVIEDRHELAELESAAHLTKP